VAIHGRTAETEKAESVARFCNGKFLGQKEPFAGARGAIEVALAFKQRGTAIESGEGIGTVGWPANIETAKANLQQYKGQQTDQHGDTREENSA
jgi:hypothetical protein